MPSPNSPSGYTNNDFFKNSTGTNSYTNPYFNISLQYLPLSVDSMLWWAQHLLIRNGFYKAALQRIANYFINTLVIETEDSKLKDKYIEMFESVDYKEKLKTSGLNLLTYSNEIFTTSQGFDRFLDCPNCHNKINIQKTNNYGFVKGKYSMKCPTPSCNHIGKCDISNQPSDDLDKVMFVSWPIREIFTRHERVSGDTEYFWEMPHDYIKNIQKKDNKFWSKVTPDYIMNAVFHQGGPKMLKLNNNNLLHLKIPHPSGIETNGKAIPMCMYIFEDFFQHQVLKRFNEVICYEDINPFRIFAMADSDSPQASPVFNQNGSLWKANIDSLVEEHRIDPASYKTFPFPVNYQRLGGEGAKLAPADLMQQSQANILGALNIPQELFNMSMQLQTLGPALRIFENVWSSVPESYNKIVQHMADVFSKIYKLEPVKASIMQVTMSDDMERKSVISQLVSANAIARSELLNMYNLDYKDQLQKKQQETKDEQEIQQRAQEEAQLEQASESSIFNQGGAQNGGGQPYSTAGSNPSDVLAQAQDIAKQLYPLDGAQRRQKLQEIKGTNQTLWSAVKGELQQMTSGAKSQGVANSKLGQ